MAKRIVNGFETIKIDEHQHGVPRIAPVSRNGLGQVFYEI